MVEWTDQLQEQVPAFLPVIRKQEWDPVVPALPFSSLVPFFAGDLPGFRRAFRNGGDSNQFFEAMLHQEVDLVVEFLFVDHVSSSLSGGSDGSSI